MAKSQDESPKVAVERMKPTLYLNEKDLSEIKKCEVGKEYEFICKAKMISKSEDSKDSPMSEGSIPKGKKKIISGRFEIAKMDLMKGHTPDINENDYSEKTIKAMEAKANE